VTAAFRDTTLVLVMSLRITRILPRAIVIVFSQESMKLMGMKVWLHWLAWFIKCAVMMILSVGFMTLFFHIKVDGRAIITYTHPSITFVFLLLYSLSIITFSFAVSTFFSKGKFSLIFVKTLSQVFPVRQNGKTLQSTFVTKV
jgi:hypothetical protein